MTMKTNEELQKNVQDAIKWEPLLHAAEIGVTVKDGVVTLTGSVDSYSKKTEAETAAQCVAGVNAVIEHIKVEFSGNGKKSDSDIATEVLNAFKFNWEIPKDDVKVKVENGWVTLEGTVDWNYQKEAAKKAILNLAGLMGISNSITIKSNSNESLEKLQVERAINRNWSLEDQEIDVKVAGHKVTLNGTVNSWYQKQEAEKLAWNTPGVWNVENELLVEYGN
jgi:osmotically-inducible protein OsmY